MKKLVMMLLAFVLIASLVACGGSSDSDDSGKKTEDDAPLVRDDESQSSEDEPLSREDEPLGRDETSTNEDVTIDDILSGNEALDTIWSQEDDATKQQMIEDAKADGYDLSFGADGSMTIVEPSGEVITQNPDGTWSYQDESGSVGQVGGDWPDNEFTRLVPKPSFEIGATNLDESGFTVVFTNVTVEELKAYAELVKKAGFTENVEQEDVAMEGMVIYTYMASNKDGMRIEVFTAAGNSGLMIHPEE